MTLPIRAVYEKGHLRLVDPVHLQEGQEVQLLILLEREQVQAALADLLVEPAAPRPLDVDEEALLQEIESDFQGKQPLSDTILAERRQGR